MNIPIPVQANVPSITPGPNRDHRMSFRLAVVASMMAACGRLSATTFSRVDLPSFVTVCHI